MSNSNLASKSGISKYLLLFAVALFVALVLRDYWLYPVIFPDEFEFSRTSRLLPFSNIHLPNFLYLVIYRATNVCGEEYLSCARGLNALFFVAATPFVYLTAKRVCSPTLAALITCLSLLGPANIYTAYFMPEALHFFVFWVFTWFILSLDQQSNMLRWCIAGTLFGLLALVKPRSLIMMLPVLIYIAFITKNINDQWVLQAAKKAFAFVALAFLTKFLFSFALAGKAGLTIFGGSHYPFLHGSGSPAAHAAAASAAPKGRHLFALLSQTLVSIEGHVLAMGLIFGLPIALAVKNLFLAITAKAEINLSQKISAFTLLNLAVLIAAACLYTALVRGLMPLETIFRLHMRYYSYMFPLLLITAGSQLSLKTDTLPVRLKAIIAFPVAGLVMYAIFTRLVQYIPSYIDNPEYKSFAANRITFYSLAILTLFSLIVWVFRGNLASKIFLYLFMPLLVLSSAVHENSFVLKRLHPDAYDNAALFIKRRLPNDKEVRFVIIGSEPKATMWRILFYIDSASPGVLSIPDGSSFDFSRFSSRTEWILVLGKHELKKTGSYKPMWTDEPALKAAGLRVFAIKHTTG